MSAAAIRLVLASVWVAFWIGSAWLEMGPYAWLVEILLSTWKEYSLYTTWFLCGIVGLAPVVLAYQWKLVPGRNLFPKLMTVVGAVIVGFGGYCIWDYVRGMRTLAVADIAAMGEVAGIVPREITIKELPRSFDFSRMMQFGAKWESEEEVVVSAYVPARADPQSSAPEMVFLRLSEAERREVIKEVDEGGKDPSRDSRPIELVRAQTKIYMRYGALGSRWMVAREPLPYIVRRRMKTEQVRALPIVISSYEAGRSVWLQRGIVALLVGGALFWIGIQDRKIW
ncbi:hypothetical protein DES53_109170 [Roseimicrobium gellanilyticum]|uniref:Uncharacterized protein n=1 Tax=Roseimicrobium gellanilyticum TaxID=748857 RepID=A0A366HBM3_9BACT|nr:hypothetical protein [Roseimicrobium gellanilyticum]RBP39743.1 hypothetical protein DES53_109170 [Roseimicrobium gellanilyticum]